MFISKVDTVEAQLTKQQVCYLAFATANLGLYCQFEKQGRVVTLLGGMTPIFLHLWVQLTRRLKFYSFLRLQHYKTIS